MVAYDYTSQLSRLGKYSVAISVIQTIRTTNLLNLLHLVPVVLSQPPRMRHLMQENISKDVLIASISLRMESNRTQRDHVGSVLRPRTINFKPERIPTPVWIFITGPNVEPTTDWGKTLAVLFTFDSNGG
ncbi:hypothetical protein E4U44_007609 [Claviceps purpurea]|nr:hypothetical protein E4U44_007609 [Claviceps purpurea]